MVLPLASDRGHDQDRWPSGGTDREILDAIASGDVSPDDPPVEVRRRSMCAGCDRPSMDCRCHRAW